MAAWGERTSSLLDLEGGSSQEQDAAFLNRLAAVDEGGSIGVRGPGQRSPVEGHQGERSPVMRGTTGVSQRSGGAASDGNVAQSAIFAAIGGGEGALDSSLQSASSPGRSMGLGLGLLRVPRSPSFPPPYGSGRSYNIRIGDEQQILAKFTPRTSQPVYYLGDTVSGVLSFPPPSQSKKPLKRHWRCLEVSVQLETHESSAPDRGGSSRHNSAGDFVEMSASAAAASNAAGDLDSASSSSSMSAKLVSLQPTASTSVVVRMEYHEVVLDLLSTHFLFTIPADAPVGSSASLRAVQWVLHFEFVAFALPSRERKPRQSIDGKANALGRIEETAEGRGMLSAATAEADESDDDESDDDGDLLQLLVEHQQNASSAAAKGLQAEKAEWSMPITVQAPPVAKRSS